MAVNGLNHLQQISPVGKGGAAPHKPNLEGGLSFKQALDSSLKNGISKDGGLANSAQGIKFSNHAVERMRLRGVSFTPEQMTRIGSAVSKAEGKGAKETLVVADNAAMIVSVKNKTIVTVMDKQALKENVFTNIDSTVII